MLGEGILTDMRGIQGLISEILGWIIYRTEESLNVFTWKFNVVRGLVTLRSNSPYQIWCFVYAKYRF